jgi:hypothetical protein
LIVSLCQAPITLAGVILLLRNVSQTDEALREARNANSIARETGERQLRAYLVTRKFSVSGIMAGNVPKIRYEIANTGQTPAYKFIVKSQLFFAEGGKSASETKVRFTKDIDCSRTLLGAGQSVAVPIRYEAPIAYDEVIAIQFGTSTLGIFGVVIYWDAFGKRRRLTFKVYLDPNYLEDNGCGVFTACERGNSGD